MNLLIVLAFVTLAIPTNTAMDKPTKDVSTLATLSHQETVYIERIPQWSHQFPLIGGGFILRDGKRGIFVNINDVQTGPDDHFEWLVGKTVFGTTPSKNVYLDMHMTQEVFSSTLEVAGILKKHSPFF